MRQSLAVRAKPRPQGPARPRRPDPRATFYDHLSAFYDWIAEASEGRPRRRAIQALSVKPGERVLEIGAGTGRALPALLRGAGPGGQVLGLDISAGMLRVARRHIARLEPRPAIRLQRGDARTLPYASGHLDAVFTSFTLELFDEGEIPSVLREAVRVLRPGGRLCVVSLVEGEATTRRARLYQWFRRRWPHLIDCRPIPLRALLKQASFQLKSTEATDVAGLPVRIVVAMKAPNPGPPVSPRLRRTTPKGLS
jgi:demethylmenaquinone methyltransferase/2-methoxy-6-polyprenyl-1,4-benzoquinol methylase